MRGRKTQGPGLVHNLEGSKHAKQRLEVILRTLTGELTIAEACELLGIRQARFNVIRRCALQAALGDLEPRRPGRPATKQDPHKTERQELHARVTQLEQELEIAAVRNELAAILPQCSVDESAVKKTSRRPTRRGRKQQKPHRKRPKVQPKPRQKKT